MKKIIFITAIIICSLLTTIGIHKAMPTSSKIGTLLENVEALAEYGEDGDIIIKTCYTVFTNQIGSDAYYSCGTTSSDPNRKYPCGSLCDEAPAWGITQQHECYLPAY